MRLGRLWLRDFRCYEGVEVSFDPGCTVITGRNGRGKTSLLEAIAWIATGRSMRGVPDRALVRAGCDEAIVRAEIDDDGRDVLVEIALRAAGRNRLMVNKQVVTRRRDLAQHLRVTVFAPDDLALVKGAPGGRRDLLDELLVAVAPRFAAVLTEYERVVKQRNALLRAGIRSEEDRMTREVLDDRLVAAGADLVRGRLRLIDRLAPAAATAYGALAASPAEIGSHYEAEWAEGLAADSVEAALGAGLATLRRREEERGVTLVGPHRDDWTLVLDGLDARHHASQGEQRTLALALRLAGHEIVTETVGADPVLLLDDVFSELDPQRSAALVAHLPAAQTLLTTAGLVPEGIRADAWLTVEEGGAVA